MTGRETIVNKALSGDELKRIILADCQRLVDNEGTLSPHVAFGRVSYTLTLKLHTDNAYAPDSGVTIESRPTQAIPAMDHAPLTNPSPDAHIGGTELARNITSPNEERLRNDMPVMAQTRGHDGTTQVEKIKYPAGAFPELGPGDVVIKDITDEARRSFQR